MQRDDHFFYMRDTARQLTCIPFKPAALMTLLQVAISSRSRLENSAGVEAFTSTAISVRRALMCGIFNARTSELCNLAMTVCGVFRGASTPYQQDVLN